MVGPAGANDAYDCAADRRSLHQAAAVPVPVGPASEGVVFVGARRRAEQPRSPDHAAIRAREVAGPDRPVEGMARAGDRGTASEGNVGVVTAPTSGRRGMGAVLVFMPTRDRTTWCSAMTTGRGKLRSQ